MIFRIFLIAIIVLPTAYVIAYIVGGSGKNIGIGPKSGFVINPPKIRFPDIGPPSR